MKFKQALILSSLFCFNLQSTEAQFFKKLAKKVEKTVEETVIRKIDEKAQKKTEKTLDTILDTKVGSKKKKRKGSKRKQQNTSEQATTAPASSKVERSPFKAYSRFDFISGEKLLVFEDFSQDEVGDLPAKWNSTNSIEVVTLEGIDGKWAKLVEGEGAFVPDFITEFPENFTFEFDVIYDFDISEYTFQRYLSLIFSDIENPAYDLEKDKPGKNGFIFTLSGGISYNGYLKYQKYTTDSQLNTHADKENQFLNKDNLGRGKVLHVSIWRQKQRMRVYLNEEKVFDIPRAFEKGVTINTARFFSSISEPDTYFFISNLRYAVGKPDLRSKLITEGKLVSYGITFDVNSSQLKPASYGTLKNIASILKEYSEIQVQIVGHTDTDGSEEANQLLSEARAAAVKKALVSEFGVPEGQLTTGGKGETEPLHPGATAEAKAKNRRVEFIKN